MEGISCLEFNFLQRRLNAGPGTKAASSVRSDRSCRNRFGQSVHGWNWPAICVTWRFSTSPSTANCEDVILFGSPFGTWVSSEQVKERVTVIQSKTGKPVQFELSENTRDSVAIWLDTPEMLRCRFMFPSRFHDRPHISTRQYGRLVRDWVTAIGLEPSGYGTHSLRRTKASEIYRKTGNLRAVQLLLGHTKVDSTVRYLGVELEDALSIAERIDI